MIKKEKDLRGSVFRNGSILTLVIIGSFAQNVYLQLLKPA